MGALTRSSVVVLCGAVSGFGGTDLADKLQPNALQAAQQRGAVDLGCPAATAEVANKRTIEAAQTTGWYEFPRQAEYTIRVAGCGQRTSYLVTCDKRGVCAEAPASSATASPASRELADKLQPNAIQAAQQRGSADLECPGATATATSKQTIEEAQTSGWYESPHRAAYRVDVTGCGKQAAYAVECDNERKGCATAGLQPAAPTKSAAGPTLADKLQPLAVQTAQQVGSQDLACPRVTTEVTRKETVSEAQVTGWYEFPYRALYTVRVAGCGKEGSYVVACNKNQKSCMPGKLLSGG